jgi:hypothetical protein
MNRSITAREIETIFAAHGSWKAGALLLEDRWALALIDRAEKHGVAIVSVDHRSPDARGHTVHEGTGLDSSSVGPTRGVTRATSSGGSSAAASSSRSPSRSGAERSGPDSPTGRFRSGLGARSSSCSTWRSSSSPRSSWPRWTRATRSDRALSDAPAERGSEEWGVRALPTDRQDDVGSVRSHGSSTS